MSKNNKREVSNAFATYSPDSIDAYIAGFPKNVQDILEKIRGIVIDAAPDAQEAIRYRIAANRLKLQEFRPTCLELW